MILGLISGALCFTGFLLALILIFRGYPHIARVTATLTALAVAMLCHTTITALAYKIIPTDFLILNGGWITALLWGWLVVGSLFVLYMPFYYTIATSLSVQTMILLDHEPRKILALRALQEHFVSRDLVQKRLETMVQNGYLHHYSEGYSLTPRGYATAIIFSRLKKLWRLGAGG